MSHPYDPAVPDHCRWCLRTSAVIARCRKQKRPKRDADDTARFHRWLSALKPPRRPVDGVKLDLQRHPIWLVDGSPNPYWPIIRVDVRMLK